MNKVTAKQIEDGAALFRNQAKFMWGSTTVGQFPRTAFPEIAFVGRSNVGKSSLINALTGQRGLAKTSKTPGRTQQFNFFNLGDRFMLVDMPGYGYASVGKQLGRMWETMADDYFKNRDQLRRLFVLIDSRHGLKDTDRMLMDWLNRLVVPYQIVLTKVDKADKDEVEKVKDEVATELKKNAAATPYVVLTSAEAKQGLEELRGIIASLR